jgi:dTMP kinase
MFVTIEGGDGVGKTTQLGLLSKALQDCGYSVVTFRDPGSTRLGESLRELLLRREDIPMVPMAEMLLYMAARAQLAEEAIRPAMAAGQIVLCDRYLLSNVVYQGHGCGLDPEKLWEIGFFITRGVVPDLTVVLDVPVEIAAERRKGKMDRLEARDDNFHRRVREGFLKEAARNPGRIKVLDASPPVEEVHRELRALVLDWIRGHTNL